MMRLLALYQYPVRELLVEVGRGLQPDTFLMGLNHLDENLRLDILDPALSRTSDLLWRITRRGPIRDRFFPANLIAQAKALRRQRDYDAIILRDVKNALLPGLVRKVRRKPGMTLLLDAILSGDARRGRRLVPFLRGIDIVSPTTRSLSRFFSSTLGLDEERLWYLPYGVDTTFFSPQHHNGTNGVISVGDTNRDYTTLLNALKNLDVSCKIFASRILTLQGSSTFSLRDVPSSLASVSYVDSLKLRAEYAKTSVVIIPLHDSLTGAGITSVLEAMSMGKPVVVARTAGMTDYVQDGVDSLTYRPGDPMDLARKVDLLFKDEALREDLGRSARQRVLKSFSTKSEGLRIQGLLQRKLGPLKEA